MYIRVKKRKDKYNNTTYYFYARKSIRNKITKKVVKKDTYLFNFSEREILNNSYKNYNLQNLNKTIDTDLENKLLEKIEEIKKVLTPTKHILTEEGKKNIYFKMYGTIEGWEKGFTK
ncbi:hypothetical protein ACQX0N_10175 [Clostridium tepidum]